MLSLDEIREIAVQFQTNEKNVAREYAQHTFLSFLYKEKAADFLLFKGGTALRLIFKSPRFSEDLDFAAGVSLFKIKELIEKTAAKVRQEIENIRLLESKTTTGGYLGILEGSIGRYPIELKIQVSTRKKPTKGELLQTLSEMFSPYTIIIMSENQIVEEKVEALITRVKPRDFYDLYFILRKPMGNRNFIASKKDVIVEKLRKIDSKFLYEELRAFLPRSHWAIIKDLPKQLQKELNRL